jgi:hypothetical protein
MILKNHVDQQKLCLVTNSYCSVFFLFRCTQPKRVWKVRTKYKISEEVKQNWHSTVLYITFISEPVRVKIFLCELLHYEEQNLFYRRFLLTASTLRGKSTLHSIKCGIPAENLTFFQNYVCSLLREPSLLIMLLSGKKKNSICVFPKKIYPSLISNIN